MEDDAVAYPGLQLGSTERSALPPPMQRACRKVSNKNGSWFMNSHDFTQFFLIPVQYIELYNYIYSIIYYG